MERVFDSAERRRRFLFTGAAILFFTSVAAWCVEPGKPSVTSLNTTVSRAIGARHPDPSIRNLDYLAEKFIGPEERAILAERDPDRLKAFDIKDTEKAWDSLSQTGGLGAALGQHMRTRYFDAALEKALAAGAKQVVILGAGFDSRAYRFDKALRGAKVFEVDYPPTQEYKKKRVREILGNLPPQAVYVPIDFTRQNLATVLRNAGYSRSKKTFFIWEGVTYYLPADAVDSTLQFVAHNSAHGSTIAFDYYFQSYLLSNEKGDRSIREHVASLGEPWIFGVPDTGVGAFLEHRGLRLLSDVDTAELTSRYLKRADGSSVSQRRGPTRICEAVVP